MTLVQKGKFLTEFSAVFVDAVNGAPLDCQFFLHLLLHLFDGANFFGLLLLEVKQLEFKF